jgi:hypothetical protein
MTGAGAGAGVFPVNLIPPVIAFFNMEKEDLFFAGARKTGSAEGEKRRGVRGSESEGGRVCVRGRESVCVCERDRQGGRCVLEMEREKQKRFSLSREFTSKKREGERKEMTTRGCRCRYM